MRSFLLILATLCASPAHANDKLLHALAGLTVFSVTNSVTACALVGAAKELYDSTGRGQVELADFLFTVVPCLVLKRKDTQVDRGVPVSDEERKDIIQWYNQR